MVSKAIEKKYNAAMKTRLGRQETQLLAYLQLRKRRTVRTGELTGPLRLSRDQERELFRRLSRGGLIARVRPGLYLVPAHLPLGGVWAPDEILALNTLMGNRNSRYQICGPNTLIIMGSTSRCRFVCMPTTIVSPVSARLDRSCFTS